jgi:hypothetical protein
MQVYEASVLWSRAQFCVYLTWVIITFFKCSKLESYSLTPMLLHPGFEDDEQEKAILAHTFHTFCKVNKYSFCPNYFKLLQCFDWNTNIRESIWNL